ncbi:hypothetical protein WL88_17495 [Burkholderia diffusa]|uniref:Uncharacterized protein n=1 Tax=Burkholderia diffusa TaxID=488732 RepID=A0AAW3PEH9_9BURK|nr:hypothetical protein WL88_17495 [Burkholderia diffusa]
MHFIDIPTSGRDAGAKRSIPALLLIDRFRKPFSQAGSRAAFFIAIPNQSDTSLRYRRLGAGVFAQGNR